MKLTVNELSYKDGWLAFSVPPRLADKALKLLGVVEGGRCVDVELKTHFKARSLNANAALWAMLNDMAGVLGSTADELYLVMLERYGVSRFIAICPEDLSKEMACHRLVREQGSTYVNGYRFLVLQVWDGSSGYNTAEFARLLDGVISEAKELDIDFISSADRDLVLSEWGQDRCGINSV